MIDVYTWPTPNGHKIHILLEELELPYTVHPINIHKGEQFSPEFLAISPNNRIPAVVDPYGPGGKPYALFESGAIMMYFADKTGKLMAMEIGARYEVIQWLMFQMGNIGPMFGQANHFRGYAPESIPYAVDRYTNEAGRLYWVLERRLSGREFLTNSYSIADIAVFTWAREPARRGQEETEFPNVMRWVKTIANRPAVQRGLKILDDHRRDPKAVIDDETRRNLFGYNQYQRR
jgi:GST-like protein